MTFDLEKAERIRRIQHPLPSRRWPEWIWATLAGAILVAGGIIGFWIGGCL